MIPNATSTDPGPYVYNVEVLANILAVQPVKNGDQVGVQVGLNPTALRDMLVPIKSQVDRLPANAKFIFNDETRQLELRKIQNWRTLKGSQRQILNDALLARTHSTWS